MSHFLIRRATVEDAADIGEISVLAWQSTYAHILPAELLANLSVDQRRMRTAGLIRQGVDYWVAVAEDQTVGFCSVGPNSDTTVPADGELKAIYLRPEQKGKGIGSKLLSVGAQHLLDKGFHSLCAYAFRDNHIGERFYTSVGAEIYDESVYNIEGIDYPDRAYLWRSLEQLVTRLSSR